MTATWRTASYRTASLSYLVATARWRWSRLIPYFGASLRCPAVTTRDRTFLLCSQARWIFVVSPPRERPSAWVSGSAESPLAGSCCWPGCRDR